MNLTLSGTVTDPFFLASPQQLHKRVGGGGSIQDRPLKWKLTGKYESQEKLLLEIFEIS